MFLHINPFLEDKILAFHLRFSFSLGGAFKIERAANKKRLRGYGQNKKKKMPIGEKGLTEGKKQSEKQTERKASGRTEQGRSKNEKSKAMGFGRLRAETDEEKNMIRTAKAVGG